MALERHRRRGEPSNTLPIEEGEENVEDEKPKEREVLTESFPGGPTYITLLLTFKTHIATDICKILILRHEFLIITCRNIIVG